MSLLTTMFLPMWQNCKWAWPSMQKRAGSKNIIFVISDQGAIHPYGPYSGRRTFVLMQFFARVLERPRLNAKIGKIASFSWTREGGVAYLQKALCRSLPPFFPCLWGSFSLHSLSFQHWLLLYFRGLSGSQPRVLGFF